MTDGKRIYALIIVIAIATHGSALRAGFIWLDHAHIEDGLALVPINEWPRLFMHGFAGTGFYRPLTALSLSLDAALGQAAWLYHAVNLAWHALAAALTALAAEGFGLSRRAAVAAGVLFAVHPLTSIVASAIAFRSESMTAVSLLALIVLHRRDRALGAALALFAGSLVKETALVLGPLFIIALEIDQASTAKRPQTNRSRLWASELLAFAAAVALRLAFAPRWRASWPALALADGIGTRFASLAKSAGRVVLPLDGTICDAFPVHFFLSSESLFGLVIIVGFAWLAWRRRGPALFLVLALLPSLQVVPVMRWWSPHYLYLPLVFAVMLLAEFVDRRVERGARVAVALTALLAPAALTEDFRYTSDEVLWEREVSKQPACREGHFYLAEVDRQAGRLEEAARHYEKAISATPRMLSYVDLVPALQNLGVVRLQQGKLDESMVALRGALEIARDEARRRMLTHNLATAELRAGNPEEATRLLEPELARPDALPVSLAIGARAAQMLGRFDEARTLARRVEAASR